MIRRVHLIILNLSGPCWCSPALVGVLHQQEFAKCSSPARNSAGVLHQKDSVHHKLTVDPPLLVFFTNKSFALRGK